MNAENVAQLLAATVAPERELAQKAEQQLEEMQKVFYYLELDICLLKIPF